MSDTFAAVAERVTPEREEEEALELVKKLAREEDGERIDEEKARKRLCHAYQAPFPAERAPDTAETIGRPA